MLGLADHTKPYLLGHVYFLYLYLNLNLSDDLLLHGGRLRERLGLRLRKPRLIPGILMCAVFGFGFQIFAADTNTLLNSWFNAQTNIQTWTADFIQTRVLKSLTQPLTATGHVWFAAPNRFRWNSAAPRKPSPCGNPTRCW